MSRPLFSRSQKHIRTYGRQTKIMDESVIADLDQPTISQILNLDNTMLMELDMSMLEDPMKSEPKKRKSDEDVKEVCDATRFHDFKTPFAPKKVKTTDSSLASTSTTLLDLPVLPTEDQNQTQCFLQNLRSEEFHFTQPVDCVNELSMNEDCFEVMINPATCSRYLRMTQKEEDDSPVLSDSLMELFKDSENELMEVKSKEVIEDTKIANFSQQKDNRAGSPMLSDSLMELFKDPSDSVPVEVKSKAVIENDTKHHLSKQQDHAAANSNQRDQSRFQKADLLKPYEVSLNMNGSAFKASSSSTPNEKNGSNRNSKPLVQRPKLLPVSSGPYRELGSFFGLTNRHKDFILKTKNIEGLYDWQEECLNLRAIHDRTNLIYALPTSGGKTLVAEIAMLREIILRKRNVMFILPYVSIVQEKVNDLMPLAMEFNFLVEEYCAGKGAIPPMKRRKKNVIFICTIEKGQILFDSLWERQRLNEIGLIVVDELHMLGDPHRGYNLEMLLAKTIANKQDRIQVIGMSATISNLREVGMFLEADLYTRDFRPVELKEYVKIGFDILSIDPKARIPSQAFSVVRSVGYDYKSQSLKRDPDHLAALVLEVIPKASCLVFCATKLNCENVAKLLTELFPKELRDYKKEEKINLIESIKLDGNGRICSTLAKTISYGIAYHHSGLTSDERKHLEEAYRLGIICVICCTSTLAAGVNLPAKRVIIRSPYVGPNFLSLTRYKQMVGRAGRAGKCETGESIMICDPRDHEKLTNLLCSKMDETISGFVQDESGNLLQTVVLNLIGMKLAHSIDGIVEFFKSSLFYVQINQTFKTVRQQIAESVQELIKAKALTFTSTTCGSRYTSFTLPDVDQEVFPDDLLAISKIGQAAVNAGLSLEATKKIDQDMNRFYKSLVLFKDLHLFYMVTPDDVIESISPDNKLLNEILMRLDGSLMPTMKAVGISEGLVMKLVSRPSSIKPSEMLEMKRFFVALMLLDLWNGKDFHDVVEKFKINRGVAFNLMSSASSKAYSLFKFCEMYEEFWVFEGMLSTFSKRLAYCCSTELLPLMELPAVKIGRAKMLYSAGFKTVADIAGTSPEDLIQSVRNVNMRQAEQIVKAAKHSMLQQIENYQEQLEEMKQIVKPHRKKEHR